VIVHFDIQERLLKFVSLRLANSPDSLYVSLCRLSMSLSLSLSLPLRLSLSLSLCLSLSVSLSLSSLSSSLCRLSMSLSSSLSLRLSLFISLSLSLAPPCSCRMDKDFQSPLHDTEVYLSALSMIKKGDEKGNPSQHSQSCLSLVCKSDEVLVSQSDHLCPPLYDLICCRD
jgi:hypothetical protein